MTVDNADLGPQTREEWIENNKQIVEGEGGTPDEVFYNEIETRLGLDILVRNEADERLGLAYIACLAHHEARNESATWAPIMPAVLVAEFKVTREEAEVVSLMAAMEYGAK